MNTRVFEINYEMGSHFFGIIIQYNQFPLFTFPVKLLS